MGENVRVVVRCRPMNKREIAEKCQSIVNIQKCSLNVINPNDATAPPKNFTYDNVYGNLVSTETIYNDICYSLVENVLEGYNGTIFAYGQTGCGKTHTMQGSNPGNSFIAANGDKGIISRSLDHIFEAISVASGVRFLALVSYLEIYNENIRDLLNPNESTTSNHALKEIPGVGITIPTLSTHTVQNASECYDLLNKGNQNRMVGETLMNATSSRSHSIFTISLEQMQNELENDHLTESKCGIRRGKLNLVDLAGSERQNKTGAAGERLREATKINLSLSALGNVISALVDGKTKHIPYRDSKLTRLLQDSLGGNTKTLMISCISPADNSYDETISTLRYASRAKNISNKPIINEDPKDAKLREYQEEILKLKELLNQSTQQVTIAPTDNHSEEDHQKWLEMEREKLKREMEAEMENFRKTQGEQKEALGSIPNGNVMESPKNNSSPRVGSIDNTDELLTQQLEARRRIDFIKQTLIGGERANDIQLKERRQKKKLDAQRRLSALAHALSRVEQSKDRDLLQEHYTDIQQELKVKNEYLKNYRQKVKALEREVSDLQSEFQLDRADYLETIRRLEMNLKFYQQLVDIALPILRKDGFYWDTEEIVEGSIWNDDIKVWKLPDLTIKSFKLPPANIVSTNVSSSIPSAAVVRHQEKIEDLDGHEVINPSFQVVNDHQSKNSWEESKFEILNNYFRRNHQKANDTKSKLNGAVYWKDFVNKIQQQKATNGNLQTLINKSSADRNGEDNESTLLMRPTHRDSSKVRQSGLVYLSQKYQNESPLNQTWGGDIKRPLASASLSDQTGYRTALLRKRLPVPAIQSKRPLRTESTTFDQPSQ